MRTLALVALPVLIAACLAVGCDHAAGQSPAPPVSAGAATSGFDVLAREMQLELITSSLWTADGTLQRAIRIFRRNVELYPESANVYDSLADALEAAAELEDALRNREEAVRRAEGTGDDRIETFRRNRDALRERLTAQEAGS